MSAGRRAPLTFLLAITLVVLLGLSGCAENDTQGSPNTDDVQYDEVVAQPEEEDWGEYDDSTSEEEDVVEESVPTTMISDGPVFISIDDGKNYSVSAFHLSHYNMETGEMIPFFHFDDDQGKYNLAVPITTVDNSLTDAKHLALFRKQLFDSKLERIAVSWYEADSSHHVGWIDREGNVVDVSSLAHPASSEFSSVLPDDYLAFFTADDLLVFYDQNENCFQYYDDTTGSIVDSYTPRVDSFGLMSPPLHKISGLDPQGHPTGFHIDCKGTEYIVADARDYVEYPDRFIFFEISEDHGEYSIVQYDSVDRITITPPTDYWIQNLAYCNDTIVFSARRGLERCLFKMERRRMRHKDSLPR